MAHLLLFMTIKGSPITNAVRTLTTPLSLVVVVVAVAVVVLMLMLMLSLVLVVAAAAAAQLVHPRAHVDVSP
jgi:hypothetical protein